MHTRTKVATALIMLLALGLVACSQGQITTSLQLAITAAEIAIPIVGSQTGIDPAILTAATNYLQAANGALGTVTDILSSGESAAVQAAKITAALSQVASVNLPPGTPQVIATALNNVATAVAKLLTNFAVNGKPKLLKPGTKIKLSSGDHKALADAKVRLAKNKAALAALKKL